MKFLKPKPKVLWFKLSGPATHAKDIGLGIGAKYDKGIYTRVNGASSESHAFCRMFELQLYNGSLPNEATYAPASFSIELSLGTASLNIPFVESASFLANQALNCWTFLDLTKNSLVK